MKEKLPEQIKATIWKFVWKVNKNLEFELVDIPFGSFEGYFANQLYLNAFNQSMKGSPKFPNNTLRLKIYQKLIYQEKSIEPFPTMKSQKRFTKESKSSYVFQLWNSRLVYKISLIFPLSSITLFGLISRLFTIKLKVYFEDLSHFYSRYPYLVDHSLSNLEFSWEEKIPKSTPQVNLVLQSDTASLDQTLIDSIRKISVAENINVVTFLLNKPGVSYSQEDFMRKLPNLILFEDKLSMIMNASQQTGYFVVLDGLSFLVALMAKEKIVLAAEPYDRRDFSWGKICLQ
jgi:hypothetical protein